MDKFDVSTSPEKRAAAAAEIVFPDMAMRWTCCSECQAGEYDAVKDMVWCGKFRHWYRGSDGCSQGPNH